MLLRVVVVVSVCLRSLQHYPMYLASWVRMCGKTWNTSWRGWAIDQSYNDVNTEACLTSAAYTFLRSKCKHLLMKKNIQD